MGSVVWLKDCEDVNVPSAAYKGPRAGLVGVAVGLLMVWTGGALGAAEAGSKQPFLLHLNGVGGKLMCDEALITGLKQGGLDAQVQFYDWTGQDKGIGALWAAERNHQEARRIAALLTERFRQDPTRPIYITSHSGGTGLAAWALEALPEEVQVEAVVMIAPALSPEYDLSKALKHVRKKLYVFSSPYDSAILGAGTKVFGTIDGQRTEAAGVNGFVRPAGADERQYEKLVPQPYQREWLVQYRSIGSHVCAMRTNFAREYMAVLLLTGRPPTTRPAQAATTRPALEGATP